MDDPSAPVKEKFYLTDDNNSRSSSYESDCYSTFDKVLPLKLDWVLTTIEAFWERRWVLMDFQCALESYVKVSNCSSLAI